MADGQRELRYLLVTIATLGCGKTTVGNALSALYGSDMGHIENDAIPSSRTKKRQFVEGTQELLKSHTLVLMDRNNAEKRERQQVFSDIQMSSNYDVRLIALNFLPNGPDYKSRELTRQLVLSRGNKHLTIRDMPESQVRMIMANFERRFQPLDTSTEPDSNFYATINLVPGDSLRNTKTIVDSLHKLGIPVRSQFTEEEIRAAYESALRYEPKVVAQQEPTNGPSGESREGGHATIEKS